MQTQVQVYLGFKSRSCGKSAKKFPGADQKKVGNRLDCTRTRYTVAFVAPQSEPLEGTAAVFTPMMRVRGEAEMRRPWHRFVALPQPPAVLPDRAEGCVDLFQLRLVIVFAVLTQEGSLVCKLYPLLP